VSAPILRLTPSQRPVFLLNSRLGLLTAASERSGSKSRHDPRHSFSRSYGVRLPSSLTRVLSITLGYLPPPTSVGLRYGRSSLSCEAFLDSVGSAESPRVAPQLPPLLSLTSRWICLPAHAYDQGRTMSNGHARPTLLCPPSGLTKDERCWNIDQLSIAYGSRPRLRPD
jgi:hypothetical protein